MYFKNEQMELTVFAYWYKFTQKFWGGRGQKWVWPVWRKCLKIPCIGRMKRYNNWFYACWYVFTKIKRWSKTFWWAWSKMRVASQVTEIENWVYLKMNWWNNWFFACWYKFRQIKWWLKIFGVDMVKNGFGQSGHENSKLTLSQKWTEGINWLFGCW